MRNNEDLSDDGIYLSNGVMTNLFDSLGRLTGKARHGLPAPVTSFQEAHSGTRVHGKIVHLWVWICGHSIGLRVCRRRSRPSRKCLRDLKEKTAPPVLMYYEDMKPETLDHKLAQCIKIGLNRLRSGLIHCLRPMRNRGLIKRCDAGRITPSVFNPFPQQC
jgi:hypothetical protein